MGPTPLPRRTRQGSADGGDRVSLIIANNYIDANTTKTKDTLYIRMTACQQRNREPIPLQNVTVVRFA